MPLHPGEATADSFDDKAIEKGRHLFTQACTFMRGVASPGQFPETDTTETAFAGRSNVGKSSLINALPATVRWREPRTRRAAHARSIFSI